MIGAVVSATTVRAATLDVLQTHLDDYLAHVAADHGRALGDRLIQSPRSWRRLATYDTVTDDQLPAVAVTSPGTFGEPTRHGDGTYRAAWLVHVLAMLRADSYDDVVEGVAIYAAAIRALLLQHPTLNGVAASLDWVGEDYDRLASETARTVGACVLSFVVDVDDVVDAYGFADPTTVTSGVIDGIDNLGEEPP